LATYILQFINVVFDTYCAIKKACINRLNSRSNSRVASEQEQENNQDQDLNVDLDIDRRRRRRRGFNEESF